MKTLSTTLKMTAAALALGTVAATSQAAIITGVEIEDVSSELTSGGPGFNRNANNTIDSSGFEPNGPGTHGNSTDADNDMWLSRGTFSNPNDPLPAEITFDLLDNYILAGFEVWNYNEEGGTARGANEVVISVASSEGGPFTVLSTENFTIAPGVDNVAFGQPIDLSGFSASDNVRLVKLTINTNHGDGNQFAGLSEIQFDGVLVPEPGSLALLGLGGLLVVRRRRG